MTQLGFLMDHRKCIGCHACTVACKAENDVPVGDFRTWVKYQEEGVFPDVRRHFAVLRCNHCTNAPCVTICPVVALDKKQNGVVDIDRDVCIGCRACMQACPYDAIYLNEDRGAVEKCHFCNHRVERGLKPACVIVCPEEAIVAGDLHDPESTISRMVRELETEVRRPEQKTGPNVHYAGHDPAILRPGTAERPPLYLWSDRPPTRPEPWPESLPLEPNRRVVLDAGHRIPWGFEVAAYLVTKGIAGGAGMLAPFVAALGLTGAAADYAPEILALVFTGLTTFLLVEDLTRPLKFLSLLWRPNPRSWLVRGAWILIAFSGVAALSLAMRLFGRDAAADALRYVEAPLGFLVAGYTAFLFRQCEGRDLWQSAWVLPHLVVASLLLGAAALVPLGSASEAAWAVAALSVLSCAIAEIERRRRHETENAAQAAAFLTRLRHVGVNPYREAMLAILAGGTLVFAVSPIAGALLIAAGLYLHEWAFVRAGQLPPLS